MGSEINQRETEKNPYDMEVSAIMYMYIIKI